MKYCNSLFIFTCIILCCKSFASTYVGQTNGSFRVDESGSASYSIPLNIPAGIAGVQPQLGFSYSSNSGDGLMGRGWNFSGASAISRCAKNLTLDKVQDNISHSANDRLCLNGQRLVTWGNQHDKNLSNYSYWNAGKYHTEIDNFSVVKAHGNTSQGPAAFTVETKSGEVHYYGLASSVSGNDSIGQPMNIALKVYGGGNESSSDAFVNAGSANIAKTWALKAIKDVKGNYIVFRYTEDAVKGEHYLKEVHYTGRTDGKSPFARVILNYIDNPKIFVGWSAGTPISMRKMLDSVTVYQDHEVFRHYALNYFTSAVLEEKNYLESIQECTDKNLTNCLPATTFSWQKPAEKSTSFTWETEPETGYRYEVAVTESFAPFSNYPSTKGRSTNRDYNQIIDLNGDGYSDIVYTSGSYWYASFGPSYSSNTQLTNTGVAKKEYAQTIDYNGDGQRDLLVANSETSNWMIISFVPSVNVVEGCETETGFEHICDSHVQNSRITLVNTGVRATGLEGNVQVADVDGDGLEDIVFRKNGHLEAYLNNDGNGSFLHDSSISNLSDSSSKTFEGNITRKTANIKTASGIDVNGDGRTDLVIKIGTMSGSCNLNSYLDSKYDCESIGGVWTVENTSQYKLLVSDGSNYSDKQTLGNYKTVKAADLNGDGYTDIMYQLGSRWYYRLSNGIEFLSPQSTNFNTSDALSHMMYFIDLNSDGRADVLHPTSSTNWHVMLSRPSTSANRVIFEKRGTKSVDKNAAVRFGDMNADGKLDLLTSTNDNGWKTYLASNPNQKDHVIDKITSGWGVETNISYKNITNTEVYFRQNSSFNVNSDYFSPKAAFYVVDNVNTQTTNNNSVSVSYQYGGLLLHKKGRGLLGFEALRTTDNQSGIVTETAYHQHWPYTGMPLSTLQMKDNVILSLSSNELKQLGTASGGIMPYIYSNTDKSNSLGSDNNQYKISTTKNVFAYDIFGNVKASTVSVADVDNSQNKLITTTTNTYGSSTLYQQKGRLTHSTVNKKLYQDGFLNSDISRQSSFDYYAGSLLLKSSIISPESNKTKQTTTYVYDPAGNKIEVWSTAAKNSIGSSFETRKSYTTFDSRYRYIASVKNHVNETTSFTYNGVSASSVTGLIDYADTTDTNGVKSRKYQNLLGQVTQSRLYGKAQINSYTYQDYCANTSCANTDAFIRISALADGKAEKQKFLDAWGREIESRVKLQDGSWRVSKTTYDQQGRVKRNYEPGKNSASSYYSEPTYDALGRVISNRQANGGFIEMAQYGKQSFTTNAKGQQTETVKNYLGQTSSVFDTIGNELRYQYNAYGQLLYVNAINRSGIENTRTTNTYDTYGNKLTTDDQDKGLWRYSYSGFGELLSQTDAQSQTVSFSYDILGRKVRRYDASGTVCWDIGNNNDKAIYSVGKLKKLRYFEGQNQPCSTTSTPSYQQSQTYYSYGLPYQQTLKVDGANYTSSTTYDNYHRVYSQSYPAKNFTIRNVYQNGYITKQLNHRTGRVYRHVESVNGRGQATAIKYGNGTSESRSYQDSTGWLKSLDANSGLLTLHGFDYDYDTIGNLTDRDVFFGIGNSSNFAEHYSYDDLNRITHRSIAISNAGDGTGVDPVEPIDPIDPCEGSGGNNLLLSQSMMSATSGVNKNFAIPGPVLPPVCLLGTSGNNSTSDNTNNQYYQLPSSYRMNESYRYDDWGNITYKQNTGYYKYDTNKTNRLLGVYQYSNFTGQQSYNFDYDDNGNVENDGKRTSDYTNFDKPYLITQDTSKTAFSYGPNREVYKRVDTRAGKQTKTLYLGGYEQVKLPSGVIEHKFYFGNVVITERSNNANDEFYLHKDHQGSTTSITNASGMVVQQFIYDPWGKQYNVHSNSIFSAYSSPGVSQGYTSHKMINDMDIIHMNGRTYNVALGRFMQADPNIQAPLNMQNYNRYGYVLNNPMSMTDPSGYFFNKLFKKLNKLLGKFAPLFSIGLSILAPWGAGFWASVGTGFIAGGIATGSLRGALVGAFTAGAFHGVGTTFEGFGKLTLGLKAAKVLAHGLVGGISSVLSGGKFGHGFASAGLTQAFSGAIDKIGGRIGNITSGSYFSTANRALRIVASAVVGGTTSHITGGKFANGAITGAFSRGFNDEAHFTSVQESWSTSFWKSMPSIPQGVVDFTSGFGDVVSFGGTKALREFMGTNSAVNFDSGYYTLGEFSGVLHSASIAGMGTMAKAIYQPQYWGRLRNAGFMSNSMLGAGVFSNYLNDNRSVATANSAMALSLTAFSFIPHGGRLMAGFFSPNIAGTSFLASKMYGQKE